MSNPNTDRDERVSVAPERIWINSGAWWSKTPYPTGSVEYIRADTAATRMRDRCVGELMKLRETYRAGARTANAEERNRDQFIFLHKANAMTDAVNQIQSLTLEGEQKQ